MPHREHAMLGPGGRVLVPRSEHDALTEAIQHITHGDYREAIDVLKGLRQQAGQGYHRNPYTPFRVVGVIGSDVHRVAYTHAKDGKQYKHEFRPGSAQAIAIERHGKREILITGDVPLWEEF